jgi:hypothetical protein
MDILIHVGDRMFEISHHDASPYLDDHYRLHAKIID